jgi:hypothetical protein
MNLTGCSLYPFMTLIDGHFIMVELGQAVGWLRRPSGLWYNPCTNYVHVNNTACFIDMAASRLGPYREEFPDTRSSPTLGVLRR